MGAWIETSLSVLQPLTAESHPTWVRGLKRTTQDTLNNLQVAPHVGAWIETERPSDAQVEAVVAPHVGAWIETRPRLNRRKAV